MLKVWDKVKSCQNARYLFYWDEIRCNCCCVVMRLLADYFRTCIGRWQYISVCMYMYCVRITRQRFSSLVPIGRLHELFIIKVRNCSRSSCDILWNQSLLTEEQLQYCKTGIAHRWCAMGIDASWESICRGNRLLRLIWDSLICTNRISTIW